jgi:hypothetical protein
MRRQGYTSTLFPIHTDLEPIRSYLKKAGLSNSDQNFSRQTGMMHLPFATIFREECHALSTLRGTRGFRKFRSEGRVTQSVLCRTMYQLRLDGGFCGSF